MGEKTPLFTDKVELKHLYYQTPEGWRIKYACVDKDPMCKQDQGFVHKFDHVAGSFYSYGTYRQGKPHGLQIDVWTSFVSIRLVRANAQKIDYEADFEKLVVIEHGFDFNPRDILDDYTY